MSEKPEKSKKGLMSRLSSFRKKKKSSSSKQGSNTSLQSSSSGSSSTKDEHVKDKKHKDKGGGSPVSSSQNSLEGFNGRTRSTSDLIEKYEKRLSGLKDDQEKPPPPAQPAKALSPERNSTSTKELTTSDPRGDPVGQGVVDSSKGDPVKTASKFRGGIRPYQSVFSGESRLEERAMSSIQEKADDTTQTEFSATSDDTDEDAARLVKVQSAKTPEMRRAQLSVTAKYGMSTTFDCSGVTRSMHQTSKPKETFIGPDSCTPPKVTSGPQKLFQTTSTPMPRSSQAIGVLKSSPSPISLSENNSTSSNSSQLGSIGQSTPRKETSISCVTQAVGRNIEHSSDSSVTTTKLRSGEDGDVWQKPQQSDPENCKMGVSSRERKKELNSTYVKPAELQKTMTLPNEETVEQSTVASGVNRTVVIEKGRKGSSKSAVDRTFSLESAGTDSLCSDDLMCDSRFAGMDESAFSEDQSSIHQSLTRPSTILGRDRTRSLDQRRKGSEDSVSSSIYSTSSVLSSPSGRNKLASADRDTLVVVEAVVYNNMVKDLAAMKLALLKLNTLLYDERVVKTRSSEVQCELMWNKSSVDTQTEVTEPVDGSPVSVASVQCSLHPPRVSRGSQYDKPKELPKPSRLAAPSTKLAKPKTPQVKENGAATESCQVSEPTEHPILQEPPLSPTTSEAEGEHPRGEEEEKRDDMKNGDVGRSVEIRVKDAGFHKARRTIADDGQSRYLKEEMDLVRDAGQNGPVLGADEKMTEPSGVGNTMEENNKSVELVTTKDNKEPGSIGSDNAGSGDGMVNVQLMGDNAKNIGSVKVESQQNSHFKGVQQEVVITEEGTKFRSKDGMNNRLDKYLDRKDKHNSYTTEDKPGRPYEDVESIHQRKEDQLNYRAEENGETSEQDLKTSLGKTEGGEDSSKGLVVQRKSPERSSKVSKLQGPKAGNLRYSQHVKTERQAPAGGSKTGRPLSGPAGLRPPQVGKSEVASKFTYQNSTKISENKTVAQSIPQNQSRIGQANSASGLKPPSSNKQTTNRQPSSNKQLSSNIAIVKPTPKEGNDQIESGASRLPPKNQNSKIQKTQKSIPQSKLSRPASYTNISQNDGVAETISLTASDKGSVDTNGNSSSTSLPDDIMNDNQRSGIPAASKPSGVSRLPKAKSTSRLPRGGGIPKMTRR